MSGYKLPIEVEATIQHQAGEIMKLKVEIERLRKIEDAAVKALCHPTWSGDEWYDDMCALNDALKGG